MDNNSLSFIVTEIYLRLIIIIIIKFIYIAPYNIGQMIKVLYRKEITFQVTNGIEKTKQENITMKYISKGKS